MKEFKLRDGEALVLRTCNADMTGYGGFKWPESGPVSAPDWDPKQECGNGLHGLLRGEGIGGHLKTLQTARWLAVRVLVSECIDLGGKVKFPRGDVVMCGDRDAVVAFVQTHHPGAAVVYGIATAGDYGTSTSGDYGTSTSGYHGTSTSGDYGTSTSGDHGTSTSGHHGTSTSGDYGTSASGDYGTSTSGYHGTSTSGYHGTSTSGHHGTSTSGDHGTSTSGHHGTSTSGHHGTSTSVYHGTSTSGYHGTSTSGDYGTSTSGYHGTSTSGYHGTSTSGHHGTATAGDGGVVCIRYRDKKSARYRFAVGYVGEDGIEPNMPYRVDDEGKFYLAEGK